MSKIFIKRRDFFNSFLKKNPLKIDGRLFNFACPCCGYPALSVKAGYDYCFICRWEDDGQEDDTGIDLPSSPNSGLTLRQARKNFEKTKDYNKLKEKPAFNKLKDKMILLYESIRKNQGKLKETTEELSNCYKEYKRLLKGIKHS